MPRHAIAALRALYDQHHEAWGKYGFADSINPNQAFVARDALGLDAGTILLAIENYRSGFVWKLTSLGTLASARRSASVHHSSGRYNRRSRKTCPLPVA